ncbi:F0F1 ATP synthase subunit delta [Methylomarinovum caldicuralii]|uniref:F0F1 ATP synthase subunit delta n=1 Tax=Methylomarinovum caldicuralii TaxID=438856 RepID=UPI0029548FE3|nr:F0F1 ATP synthase subunit delta [Methylomarinovum caldicuralii]
MDWLTVVAQIVNFLILAALLKRFLYRPIVTAMAARQAHIERQLQEARHLKAQAERLIATYRRRLEEVEQQNQQLLEQARQEAERERQALLDQARLEVEAKRRQWLEALAREQHQLARDLERLLGEQLIALGRKAFAELAGRRLEACLVETFLERLETSPELQRLLTEAGSREWTVVTAQPLDADLRRRIETALRRFNPDVRVRFVERDALILGIALEAGDRVWSWNLAAWLEQLEAELQRFLQSLPS